MSACACVCAARARVCNVCVCARARVLVYLMRVHVCECTCASVLVYLMRVHVCVCVCEREREREKKKPTAATKLRCSFIVKTHLINKQGNHKVNLKQRTHTETVCELHKLINCLPWSIQIPILHWFRTSLWFSDCRGYGKIGTARENLAS